ncbi:MAG: EAL domain-containing protein [Geminicoccaceae bacterium]|nr:EAL domain-containing protein [Geminicoccaceae bacterium]
MNWFEDLEADLKCASEAAVLAIRLPNFRNSMIASGADFGIAVIEAIHGRLDDRLGGKMICRSWGDEIFAVVRDAHALGAVSQLAMKVEAAFDEPLSCLGVPLHVRPAIGISLSPEDGTRLRELLSKAQIASDNALHSSCRTQLFAGPMAEGIYRASAIENALREAMANQALSLVFQPQFDLNIGRFSGVEALVRWEDVRIGAVAPSDFIPIAERSGFIPRLGGWVLEEAARQFSEHGIAETGLEMAVNVSPRQLTERSFVFEVEDVLESSGIRPEQMTIEITEGLMLEDIRATSATLNEVRSLGVRTAIDDFGTGFSNFSYLRNLPIDQLKIDRDFVKHLGRDPRSRTVLEATINLGHGLGLQVCVEGVETAEQMAEVRSMGCDLVQGFYLGRPCSIEQLDQNMKMDYRRILGMTEEAVASMQRLHVSGVAGNMSSGSGD